MSFKTKKEVFVRFDEEAYNEYKKLKEAVSRGEKSRQEPTYEQLLNSINKAIINLKINPHSGDLIPRKYIPKRTVKIYGTDKIFKVNLVGYWRLLYTLIGSELRIIAFILEYMDHSKYNKLFGYKKK